MLLRKSHITKYYFFLFFFVVGFINPETLTGQVKLVQHGNSSIPSGSSQTTINLPTAVVSGKSILIVTAAPGTTSTNGPAHTNVMSQLNCTNPTDLCSSIRVERHSSTGLIDIKWYIVEFESYASVNVHRGTVFHSQFTQNTPKTLPGYVSDTYNIPLGVENGKSFVLLSDYVGGIVTTHDDSVEGELVNGDLLLTIGDAKPSGDPLMGEVAWQVIEYGNSVVKQGDFSLTGADTNQTIAVSGGIPNPEKSWLIYNFSNNVYSPPYDVDKLLIRGSIDGNNVVFDRDLGDWSPASNYTVDGTYYLVEFTDQTYVQHANMSFSSTTTTDNEKLQYRVNTDCAIPVVGYHQRGGKAPFQNSTSTGTSPGTNFAPGWYMPEITNEGHDITLTRGETGSVASEAYWFVLEFDYCQPPIDAWDDSGTGSIGEPSSIDILPNDLLGDRLTYASPGLITIDLDPGTSGNQSSLVVSGEGTWSYDNGSGLLTFTPEPGFLQSPTPIDYVITENSTDMTDKARVTLVLDFLPSLSISKSASPSVDLAVGETVTYTIVVENDGLIDVNDIVVSDILPAGLIYTPNSAQKSYWEDQGGQQSGSYTHEFGANSFTHTGLLQSVEITDNEVPSSAVLTSYSLSTTGNVPVDWLSDISLNATYPGGSAFQLNAGSFGGNGSGNWSEQRGPLSLSFSALGAYEFNWDDAYTGNNSVNNISTANFTIQYTYNDNDRVQITDAAGTPSNLVLASDHITLKPGEQMIITLDVTVDVDAQESITNTATADISAFASPISADATISIEDPCVSINLGVYLEGPWDSVNRIMKKDLNDSHLLPGQDLTESTNPLVEILGEATPVGQPYDRYPWNFTSDVGDRYGDAGTNNHPDRIAYDPDIVDWVLLSVREGDSLASNMIWRCVGLLYQDGQVEIPSGCGCLEGIPGEKYYMVVEHRNHMPVMTQVLELTDGELSFDFRIQDSWIWEVIPGFQLGRGQKQDGADYMMFAGNGDQDPGDFDRRDVNSGDNSVWFSETGNLYIYLDGDFDMDADFNSGDDSKWFGNAGITNTQTPLKSED